MLTKLTIRNFKQFDEVEIELGDNVVLIGPNNSGKTSALQALALWQLGVRRWWEKRPDGDKIPKQRPGVPINRAELTAVPVPDTRHLWRALRTTHGRAKTVPIVVGVEGVTQGLSWACDMQFTYANDESLYCTCVERGSSEPVAVAQGASGVSIAYLPPMSGLAATEDKLERGSIALRIGQGRTADVLRNLCHRVWEGDRAGWNALTERMHGLFGVTLRAPEYQVATGQITLSYDDAGGTTLDISAAGRGLQQTLLLLAYLAESPGAVLLLDEPDAHLEFLRQEQIYDTLTEAARASGGQIVAASHSEAVMGRAGDRDVVVAFVGKPHRIDDRAKSQVAKALKEIGFDQYYLATLRGWVLYLEGSTDLAMLRAWARLTGHEADTFLTRAFVKSIGSNDRGIAARHFFGLREAKPDLAGIVLLDRDAKADDEMRSPLRQIRWRRREIENYLVHLPELLMQYARSEAQPEERGGPLLRRLEEIELESAMKAAIDGQTAPDALRDPHDAHWIDTKISDEYLTRVFRSFYGRLGLPNRMNKSDYHVLARFMRPEDVHPEVTEKLDAIVEVARTARPEGEPSP